MATGDGSVNVFTAIVLSYVVIAAVGPGHYRSRGDRVARNLTTILLFRKITSYLICNALKTPWIDIRWIIGLDILDTRENRKRRGEKRKGRRRKRGKDEKRKGRGWRRKKKKSNMEVIRK